MTDLHCNWNTFKKESLNHEVKKANALSSLSFSFGKKDVAGVPLMHGVVGPREENFSSKCMSYENEEKQCEKYHQRIHCDKK